MLISPASCQVIATYRPLLQRLVYAIEILVLFDEASLQQIAWHNSNKSLGVLQLEVNGVCVVWRVQQVSLQHHYFAVVMLPGVFLSVWHASQNPAG